MRKLIRALIFTLSFSIWAAAAKADEDNTYAWETLRSGDAVILMRHALAPGTGDPAEFELDDCATQRNLSGEGRTQAAKIGDVLRSNDIANATVLSSQWCRCLETAALLNVGKPQPTPIVNSFFQDWSTEGDQTQALHESLRNWLATDNDVKVIVTHQVNISALTGQYTSSGDMLIVTLQNDVPVVLAQIGTN